MTLTIIIVLVYFVIGGVATAIVNKKKPEGAKERWVKYCLYFLIVALTIAATWLHYLFYLSIIIAAVGLYEVIRVGRGKNKILVTGIIVYVVIAQVFLVFSYNTYIGYDPLMVYLIVLVFDGFSQISGQLFGKRKLVPSISPGKTVEGLIGGMLMALITITIAWPVPFLYQIGFGILICVSAFAGDLLASFYKRKCGVKDYSNLIPGHGGVLDRFDSFIFAGAIWLLTW